MTRRHHALWLRITAILIGVFGPVFSLGSMESTQEPARLSLDILAWPIDGVPTYASPDTRFLSALTGGFLLGWGVLIWCLATRVHRHAPDAVRRAVVTGLCSWFVLDSAGSIASGNPSNAGFNVLVLLILVGPLWVSAKEDRGTGCTADSSRSPQRGSARAHPHASLKPAKQTRISGT